ncbi:MAG: tetratricopeptide repeat protein [Candidatus Hydrogenedentes bacterium]|nr:tetratricopeptide repeat protein [Candidatus Hydrogenedentota bacterium]
MEMSIRELEAAAVAAVEEGRDPKMPLSRMLSLSHQDEESARSYLESMERISDLLPADEQYWEARLGMARAAEYLNDHEYVDRIFGELVARDPALETAAGRSAYYNHARSMFQRGEREEAIARYRKVWEVSARYSAEEFALFGRQLGSAYATNGDWENAVEILPAVLGPLDNEKNFIVTLTLANAYVELERFDEAAKLFRQLYNFRKKIDATDPDHPIQNLGEFYTANRLEARMEWAEMGREGQQHRLAAAERAAREAAAAETREGADAAEEPPALAPEVAPAPVDSPVPTPESPSVEAKSRAVYGWGGALALVMVAAALGLKLAR